MIEEYIRMTKVLETHYEFKNNSSQCRIIEVEDFQKYITHILESNENKKNTEIINGIDNREGCTLGKLEMITNILQDIKGECFTFTKQNVFNGNTSVVSLVSLN
jgi:uncharacterized protein (UPF0128 family)